MYQWNVSVNMMNSVADETQNRQQATADLRKTLVYLETQQQLITAMNNRNRKSPSRNNVAIVADDDIDAVRIDEPDYDSDEDNTRHQEERRKRREGYASGRVILTNDLESLEDFAEAPSGSKRDTVREESIGRHHIDDSGSCLVDDSRTDLSRAMSSPRIVLQPDGTKPVVLYEGNDVEPMPQKPIALKPEERQSKPVETDNFETERLAEDDKRRNTAATKVQATYRGHATRRDLKKQRQESQPAVEPAAQDPSVPKDDNEEFVF